MSARKTPIKAYKNIDFLNSSDARIARILCECLEPLSRFKKYIQDKGILLLDDIFAADIRMYLLELAETSNKGGVHAQGR